MDDDWRIDGGLLTLRTRIYELLPGDWEFYGPIKRATGMVGRRPNTNTDPRPPELDRSHQPQPRRGVPGVGRGDQAARAAADKVQLTVSV